jgi:polyhydroxyalkanoate synthase
LYGNCGGREKAIFGLRWIKAGLRHILSFEKVKETIMAYPKLVEPMPPVERKPAASVEASAEPKPASLQGLDRSLHSAMAAFTGGLAPTALAGAYLDWWTHLMLSPGKQLELLRSAIAGEIENSAFAPCSVEGTDDGPRLVRKNDDARFSGAEWNAPPFNLYVKLFGSAEKWWDLATTGVRGVSKQHEDILRFAARQLLDTVAPSNFILTNPRVIDRTVKTGGQNLVRGWQNFVEDVARYSAGSPPAESGQFRVGETVAITPGKVVYRNRLAEIIQYSPATGAVRPEPVVIVPAWIMKYYILDLSPANSLVKFLVEQGFTVFMISWKNPDENDRNLSMDDYRLDGVMAAIDAATRITGARKVHAVGYCLGGTLLSIAAAAMMRDGDRRIATLSMLAAQTDFTEAGELKLFINESQVAFLEDMMWERGYLEASQMAGAFRMLRSNDLIWSRIIHDYLMGERSAPMDIMAWNADATRMPYRMHSEYLRALFLNNDLAEGRFLVDGRPVAIQDIRAPMFAVGTEKDHVAPWRSVFKFHLLSDLDLTFALTSGGHNAGIIAGREASKRHYRIARHRNNDCYVDPETWYAQNDEKRGSWWLPWVQWLNSHSAAAVPPPSLGNEAAGYVPLQDAPGSYVLLK